MRPSFDDAVRAFQALLAKQDLSSTVAWVFAEQLCLLPGHPEDDGFRVAIRTDDDVSEVEARALYEAVAPDDGDLVFYVVSATPERTIATLAGDSFEAEDGDYDAERNLYFVLEPFPHATEVADANTWKRMTAKRSRMLSGLDFVYPLAHLDADGD